MILCPKCAKTHLYTNICDLKRLLQELRPLGPQGNRGEGALFNISVNFPTKENFFKILCGRQAAGINSYRPTLYIPICCLQSIAVCLKFSSYMIGSLSQVRKLDDARFPSEQSAFAFLQPMHMQTFDAQIQRICRLPARYRLDTERLCRWLLAKLQFKAANLDKLLCVLC
jgi:hypothetical protein